MPLVRASVPQDCQQRALAAGGGLLCARGFVLDILPLRVRVALGLYVSLVF